MSQIGYGAYDCIGAAREWYTPLTAFNIVAQTDSVLLTPAGTLATGTLTLPLNPPDGAKFVLQSTQTQTAITINANTGDSLVVPAGGLAAITALVANTKYEYTYFLNGNRTTGLLPRSWIRTQ
jgi:hypothetical protein